MNCLGCNSTIPPDLMTCPHCGFTVVQDSSFGQTNLTVSESPVMDVLPPPPFFAVPVWKLALMSFVTFGLYEFFWFYQNWQRVRVRERANISPFWRAFFGVIFCHPCFAKIESYGAGKGVTPGPQILPLTISWIVLCLSWRLPDPFWLLSLFSFAPLLPMQAYVNRINERESPEHDRNAQLTVWNWVGVVVGGGLFALSVYGLIAVPN